jgi:hypothetical protein
LKTLPVICYRDIIMKSDFRRMIALLLLLVTFTGLAVSFGEQIAEAGEHSRSHGAQTAVSSGDKGLVHGHDCPCPDDPAGTTDNHFCTGGCGCPCQAPLSSAAVVCAYSPTCTYLIHTEVTRHIPEVYLDRFIPPQVPA